MDAEAIPGGLEPGSGSAKLKFGESTGRKKTSRWAVTRGGKCSELIFDRPDENLKTCTSCGYHFPISARARLESLIDEGSFKEMDAGMASVDVLKFTGVASYLSKLERYQEKTVSRMRSSPGSARWGRTRSRWDHGFFIPRRLDGVGGRRKVDASHRGRHHGQDTEVIISTSGGADVRGDVQPDADGQDSGVGVPRRPSCRTSET